MRTARLSIVPGGCRDLVPGRCCDLDLGGRVGSEVLWPGPGGRCCDLVRSGERCCCPLLPLPLTMWPIPWCIWCHTSPPCSVTEWQTPAGGKHDTVPRYECKFIMMMSWVTRCTMLKYHHVHFPPPSPAPCFGKCIGIFPFYGKFTEFPWKSHSFPVTRGKIP